MRPDPLLFGPMTHRLLPKQRSVCWRRSLWLAAAALALQGASAAAQPALDSYSACIALVDSNPTAALELAKSLSDAGADDSGTHCRAVALFQNGQPDQAANLFEQLASDSANSTERGQLLVQAASAQAAAGQLRQALERATEASALLPKEAEPWLIIAEVQSARDAHSEALSALGFAEALIAEDRRTELLVLKAKINRKADRLDAARLALVDALERDPGNAAALLELGVLFFELGDDANAALVWGDLNDLHPDLPEGLQAVTYLERLRTLQAPGGDNGAGTTTPARSNR